MKKLLRNAAWLLAFCGLAVSAYAQTCNPITITPASALEENFDSYASTAGTTYNDVGSTVLPSCWIPIYNGSNTDCKPHLMKNSSYHDGSTCIVMTSGTSSTYGSDNYVSLPGVTNDLSNITLMFDVDMEGLFGTLSVGYMTDPNNASTFTPVTTIANTKTPLTKEVSFENFPTTGTVYVAFKWSYTSNYWSVTIDNVFLGYKPDCPAPTDLTVTPFESYTYQGNTKFRCDFSWTDTTNAGSYKYIFVPQGSAVDWSSNTASTTPAVYGNEVAPLNPQTSYDLYVKIDNCTTGNGIAAVAGPLTITTPCLPSPLPYTEDFEQMDAYTSTYGYNTSIASQYIPACWTIVPNSYTTTGYYSADYDCTPHVYSVSGNKCLIIGAGNSSISGIAALPPISGSLADMQILFKDKRAYSTTGTLDLGYYANGTFNSLTTVTDGSTDWTERSYNLGDLTGIANAPAGAQIAFKFSYSSNSSSYYALIDDITVRLAPDCESPTALTATNITASEATLEWTAGGNETAWEVAYGVAGFDLAQATTHNASTNSLPVNDLTGNTAYEFYVKAQCNGLTYWAGPYAFRTECNALTITENDYIDENFDSYSGVGSLSAVGTGDVKPYCWNYIFNGTDESHRPHLMGNYSNYHNSSNCLSICTGSSSFPEYGSPNYMIMPAVTNNLNELQLSFAVDVENAANTKLEVGYMTNPSVESSFVSVQEITCSSTPTTVPDIIFSDNVPGPVYVAFKVTQIATSSWYGVTIDSVVLSLKPACSAPMNVAVNNVTPTTADVNWQPTGEETSWLVKWTWGTNGKDSATVSSHPYTIPNLTENTAYTVMVKALCGQANESEYTAPVAFRTACNAITITENTPFSENFNSYSAGASSSISSVGTVEYPDCWTTISGDNSSYRPHLYKGTSYNAGGSPCMAMTSGTRYAGEMNFVVLPGITNNLDELKLSCNVQMESASYGELSVGYLTDPADSTTFTLLQTIPSAASHTQHEISLSGATQGTTYLAFKWYCSGTYYSCTIDSVVVFLKSSCEMPSNLAVANVTTTTANVSWTPGYNETQWEVKWTWGTNEKDSAVVQGTPAYTIPNLTPATSYNVCVRSLCPATDEVTDWTNTIAFTTECDTFVLTNSTQFRETFENSTAIPTCWNNEEGTATDPWTYTSAGGNEGTHGVYLDCYFNSTNKTSILKTPVIDMTQVTGATLTFYWKYGSSNSTGKIDVLISTDGGTTFATTPLLSDLRNKSTYQLATVDLTSYCGAGFDRVVVGFRGTVYESYSYDMYLDDIIVTPILPCSTPTAVTATAIADSAAQVSWTAGGEETSWNLRYFATGGDTTTLTGVTNPYTVQGLAENTTYHFEVQADCGDVDGLSLWSDEATATTSCSPKTLPYADNFNYTDGRIISTSYSDATAAMADCWDYIYTGTTASYRPHLYRGTNSPVANDTALIITSYNSNSYGKGNILLFPVINADLQHVLVSFDYTQTNSTASANTYLQFGYVTDPTDTATFTAITTLPHVHYSATPRSKHAEIFVSDYVSQPLTNVRLAIRWMNNTTSTYNATIDNVKVETEPACRKPVNITATNITNNSATLTWDARGNETAYLVSYKPVGGAAQEVFPTTNTAVLNNLTGNTTYTVEILADCGNDGQSSISDVYTFTTECDPFVVTMATPFVENFNSISSGIPACWNNEEGTTTTDSYRWNSDASGHDGNCVKFNSYNNLSGNTNFLKSKTLDLSQAVNGAELSFWLKYATATTDTTEGRFDLYLYTANDTVQLARNIRNVANWTEYTYDISNYAGAGYDFVKLVFKGTSDYGSHNLYLDDVKVKALLPCHTPANVSVVGVSENSLTFGWDAVEGAVMYNVNYADSVGVAGQGLMDTTSVPSYTFTHLGLDTTIYIYVQADCGATDGLSEWIAVAVSGTTPACAAITVTEEMPYIEDFTNVTAGTSTTNSATAGFPDCWTRVYQVLGSDYDYTPHVYTGIYAPAASNNALLLGANTSYGNPAYVALPQFTNPMADLALSFTTAMSSATYGTLKVGYMMNPTNENSFVELETIPNNYYSNSATRSVAHTIYLRDYQSIPDGAFIAFKWSSTGSTYYCAIDDIQMFIAPTCLAPDDVVVSNITGNSATVNWSPRYEESNWFYYYGLEGFDPRPDAGEYIGVGYVSADMLPLNLEGLTENTAYDFYVLSDCSSELSEMSEAFSFRTPCASLDVPWSEDFDSYEFAAGYAGPRILPDCWSYVGTPYVTPGVYHSGTSTYCPTGDGNALGLHGASSGSSYVTIMPAFNNNLRELQISFKYAQESLNSGHILSIGYVTDVNDQTTFVALDTMPVTGISKNTYYDYEVVFKQYAQTFPEGAQIAFKYHYQGYYIACIDDISVELAPACIAPAGIAANNITDSSATITWMPRDSETQWEVACLPQGTTPTQGTIAQTNTLTVGGLTASTTYDVYVRALCSETAQSEWAGPYSFTTNCLPLALPYSEDFESYYASTVVYTTNVDSIARWQVPTCWEAPTTLDDTYDYNTTAHIYRGVRAPGNTKAIYMQAGLANYAILPAFNDLSNAEILFDIYQDLDPDYESVSFGYILNGSFTSLEDIPYSSDDDGWIRYEYMLDQYTIPAGARLAFSCIDIEESYYGLGAAIDNIIVREIPTCFTPTTVLTGNAGTDTVQLTWLPAHGETAWNIEYGEAGFEQGTGTTIAVADTNAAVIYTLRNLTASTHYDLYIQGDCGEGDLGYWNGPFTFTTQCVAFALPFSEDFNSLTTGIPDCWDNSEGTTTTDSDRWNYYESGYAGHGLRFNSWDNLSGETNMLKTPAISIPDGSRVELEFYYKNPTGGDFSVYVSTDGGATYLDNAIATDLTGQTGWTSRTFELTQFAGNDVVIVFMGTSNYGSGDAYIYLDNVELRYLPDCETPTDVMVENITTSTAAISWTSTDSTAAWNVTYYDVVDSITATVTANEPTITLQNLTASTTYNFTVVAVCDGVTYPTDEYSFTTECDAYTITTEAPYSEDFESYTAVTSQGSTPNMMADCWDDIYAGTNAAYRPKVYSNSSRMGGSKCLNIVSSSNLSYGGPDNYVILPAFTNELSALKIAFATQWEDLSYGTLEIGYITNSSDAETFVPFDVQITPNIGSAAPHAYELRDYTLPTENARLAFHWSNNSTWYGVFIDNVVVSLLPDCETPTDVMVENITASTAAISWTSTDSTAAWNVTYAAAGDSVSTIVTANEPTITLQNLTASTTYNFTVMAVCDGVTYPTDEYSFTTECEPYTITEAAPYTEDFTDYTASSSYSSAGVMPSCWNRIYTGSSSAYASHVFKNASYTPTANNNAISIVAQKNSTSLGQENYIILPAFTNPLADLKIEFATAMSSSDGKLSIGFITDPSDADSYSSFENIPTNLHSSSARYTSHEIYVYDYLEDYDIPEGARLAFKWKNDQSSSISIVAIDDIVVSLYQLYDTVSHVACDVYVDEEGNRYEETTSIIETEADGEHIYNHVTYYEINHSVNVELAETACDSFVWNDTTIYTTGQYVKYYTTTENCDSIVTLNVTINNHAEFEFSDSACLTYTWNNRTFTESGDYVDTLATVENCDSIVTLHLTILHGTHEEFTDQTCDTSYTWNWRGVDAVYYSSGVYTRYATGDNGCEDTAVLNVTFYTPVTTNIVAQICEGETYSLYNFNETQAGTYTQTGLQTVNGCDSTVILTLTVGEQAETSVAAVICEGEDYTENGFNIMQPAPGIVLDTLNFTREGTCDSVVYLTLTVNAKTYYTDIHEACDSFTWIDGETYRTSINTPTVILRNAAGCDSIVTLDLTIYNSVSTDDYQVACESYVWNNETYTESGDYVDTLATINGCDSIVTLHLTINRITYGTDVQRACNTFTWIDGQTYTQSTNTPTWTLVNAAGCDSIVTLDLTINRSVMGRDSITACDSYTWIDGLTYTESTYGEHVYFLTSVEGCDSTAVLYLTINQGYYDTTRVEACDSYTWTNGDGRTYRSSREVTYALTTAAGCDSIMVLDLTINYTETTTDVQEACDSFTWIDGQTYTASTNTPTWTLTSSHGCDSIVTLDLTIHNSVTTTLNESACGSYTWAVTGETYTETGDYPVTLTSMYGCDSTVILHVVIYEMPVIEITGETEIEEGESTTLSVTEGEGWNYSWTTGDRVPEITVTPTETTTYTVIVSNGSCIANASVTVQVHVGLNDYVATIERLYPNPADEYCTIEAANMQTIQVFNMNGQLVNSYRVDNADSYRIETTTYAPGVYFVKVITTANKVVTAKFVVKH